jgi:hypothetical protein
MIMAYNYNTQCFASTQSASHTDCDPYKGHTAVFSSVNLIICALPLSSALPMSTTPADETPADETPTDETPADETPADETPADEAPADETPANGGWIIYTETKPQPKDFHVQGALSLCTALRK